MRYYYIKGHPRANDMGMVAATDVDFEESHPQAKDAPVMVGRFYENQKMLDGTDVGSRTKYRDYLRARGLTQANDYTKTWEKAAERRAKFYTAGGDQAEHKARREVVGRAWYEHVNRKHRE